jgi:hypothetical protein
MRIDTMDLENALREIEPDRGNLHVDAPSLGGALH